MYKIKNKVYLPIIIFMFNVNLLLSQNIVRDTTYIKWNDSYSEMSSSKGFNFKIDNKTKDNLSHFYRFKKINFKYHSINFRHIIMATDSISLKMAGEEIINPIKKTVDSTFLKNKNVLDINYFQNHTYSEIYNKFKCCDIVFIFNECKSNRNNIELVQVWLEREINE